MGVLLGPDLPFKNHYFYCWVKVGLKEGKREVRKTYLQGDNAMVWTGGAVNRGWNNRDGNGER